MKHLSGKNMDLTAGAIVPQIFSYSIPLIIGSLIQVMFNMADQVVLGQMAGTVAVASVGACSTIAGLVVNFLVGLSGGVTVILARAVGAGDKERSNRILSTAILAATALGLVGMSISLPLADSLLTLTQCPADCYAGALTYLRIYYAAIPAIILYNFGAAILRVSGDSRRPTAYLVAAGALNVVLNVALCLVLPDKVMAVAIATLASQVLGAVLTIVRLTRLTEGYKLDFRHLTFDRDTFGKILRYGVPCGLNSSLFCIANLQVQAGVNSYGSAATAGQAAGGTIEGILSAVVSGFGHTITAMVGQNIGAGKKDRVARSFFFSTFFSAAISTVLAFSVYAFRRPLLQLLIPNDEEAFVYAVSRLRHVLLFFAINACNNALGSALNAFGYSLFTMLNSLVSTIVLRTIWMQIIYPRVLTFDNIMLCYTVSWSLILVINVIAFSYVYRKYLTNKLKEI